MRCRIAVCLGWAMLMALSSCLPAAEPGYKPLVVTDPPDAIYSVGKPAKFVVNLKKCDQPVTEADLVCTLDKDGMPPVTQKKLTLAVSFRAT